MSDPPEQLDLNFHAPVGDGYANWQWDREQAVREVAAVWGLPLGQTVRVRLHGIDGESVGVLRLAELPRRLDRRRPLRLKMGRHVFESGELEACSVVQA